MDALPDLNKKIPSVSDMRSLTVPKHRKQQLLHMVEERCCLVAQVRLFRNVSICLSTSGALCMNHDGAKLGRPSPVKGWKKYETEKPLSPDAAAAAAATELGN